MVGEAVYGRGIDGRGIDGRGNDDREKDVVPESDLQLLQSTKCIT